MTLARAIELLKELSSGVGVCTTEEDLEALNLVIKKLKKDKK